MEIFSIAAVAVCAVLLITVVKKGYEEYAILMTLLVAIVILLFSMEQIAPLINQLSLFAESGILPKEYFSILLKTVGITIVGQLASKVCSDAEEEALEYAVNLASKFAILILSMPLITRVFELLSEILR